MALLVLTVVGNDQAGLVSALADAVAEGGGNWERSQMAELGGKFAGIVTVTVPSDRRDALVAALEPLNGLLDVHVEEGEDAADTAELSQLTLDITGNDHPGIVQEISGVLARHKFSFDTLETSIEDAPMAGGKIFQATATLHALPDADLSPVKADLERLADELMVDITFD